MQKLYENMELFQKMQLSLSIVYIANRSKIAVEYMLVNIVLMIDLRIYIKEIIHVTNVELSINIISFETVETLFQ